MDYVLTFDPEDTLYIVCSKMRSNSSAYSASESGDQQANINSSRRYNAFVQNSYADTLMKLTKMKK